jgi:hypothetical protein
MKKRILAIALALTMVVGTGMTAMAAEENTTSQSESKTHDTAGTDHGDKTDALLGPDGQFENQSGSTQFYINIDKDATSGKVEITEPSIEPGNDDGEVCHYYIERKVTKESKISATVPLYVCMYGYGGDGRVVTPGTDAYQITNESTYSVSEEVTLINPCYPVTKIIPYGDYTVDEQSEKSKGEQYENYITKELELPYNVDLVSSEYGYYTKGGTKTAVELAKCSKHSELAEDCENTSEYYYQDPEAMDSNNYETVVESTSQKRGPQGLPLNIASIQTEINTWALKPVTTANELKAGELAMTINSLDLSKVSAAKDSKLDITSLNWTVDAPTVTDGNAGDEGKLSLPIQAQIAGGNVNEEGCVPVVKVTYTVTPNELINEIPKDPPSDES